jgi:hypothetical protein
VTAPEVHVAGGGRRAAARKRRRQRRRRLVALAVVLLLASAGAVAFLLGRQSPEAPPVVEPQGRTQQTLLFQVRTADGAGTLASALLAVDPPSSTGSVVLVPPQVIVDLPGAGSLPFGQALASGSPNSPRDALSDLLGVTVDGSWVLEHGAFGGLVNELGGITAGVDVPVVEGGAVVLSQGEQRLDGARALTFLGHLGQGEQEQSRLARVQEVLDGVLAALPDDPAAVSALIDRLGTGSVSSEPSARLATVLRELVRAGEEQQLQYDSLPVIPIDPGGGVVAFRLDAEAARSLVDRVLAQSVPTGARQTGNRVLVLNGVGPGIGDAARAKLVAADFVFVGARNNERFGIQTTQVLVPEATPEAQALGERVAAALGVPADVRQSNLGTIADAVVIIGADFVPAP